MQLVVNHSGDLVDHEQYGEEQAMSNGKSAETGKQKWWPRICISCSKQDGQQQANLSGDDKQ